MPDEEIKTLLEQFRGKGPRSVVTAFRPIRDRETREERDARVARQRSNAIGVLPDRFADAAYADFAGSEHHQKLATWYDHGPTNLVISGSLGSGKTYAAAAIMNDACERGPRPRPVFITIGEFIRAISVSDNDPALLRIARESRLLVFDDLGAEANATEAFNGQLLALFDHRYARRMRTVITTNTDGSLTEISRTFTNRYGQRVSERIVNECGRIRFDGQTRRRAGKPW